MPCIPHIQLCVLILIFSPTSFHRECLTITQCDLWYVTKVWEIKQWKKYIVLGESIWCVIANNNFMYYIKHIFFCRSIHIFWKLGFGTNDSISSTVLWSLGTSASVQGKKKKTHIHIQMYIHIHHDVYTSYTWETLNSQAVSPMPLRWPWH